MIRGDTAQEFGQSCNLLGTIGVAQNALDAAQTVCRHDFAHSRLFSQALSSSARKLSFQRVLSSPPRIGGVRGRSWLRGNWVSSPGQWGSGRRGRLRWLAACTYRATIKTGRCGLMSKKAYKRKRFFVDAKVQGALIARVLVYWMTCLITIAMLLLCWRVGTDLSRPFYTQLDELWFDHAPALVAAVMILPLLVLDIVKMSNRFVGPILRLRRAMRQLAQGEHVEPIKFRKSDFWRAFAEEFNVVAERMEALSAAQPEPESQETLCAEETVEAAGAVC